MLICADARMLPIKSDTFKLVYADPPHSIYYDYGNVCTQQNVIDWLLEVNRVAKHNSWIVINIGRYPIRHFYECIIKHLGFTYDHEIIWHFDFGTYTRSRFVPSHVLFAVLKKGAPKFHWEQSAIKSQRQLKGDHRADPRGRVPGTVFSIPRVPGNSKQREYLKGDHRSSQPEPLMKAIINAFTRPGEAVLDLFLGSGSMAYCCSLMNRSWCGIDNRVECVLETRERIENEWKRKFLK